MQDFEIFGTVAVVAVQLLSGVDHVGALRGDLRPAAEAGEIVAYVAVGLLDGQVENSTPGCFSNAGAASGNLEILFSIRASCVSNGIRDCGQWLR